MITKEGREEKFARVEENTQKIPRIYLEFRLHGEPRLKFKNCFPSGIPSRLSHSGQSLQEEVGACTSVVTNIRIIRIFE